MPVPFRIEVIGSREVHIYTPHDVKEVAQHFLNYGTTAFPEEGYVAVESDWKTVLKELIDYDGDLERPSE